MAAPAEEKIIIMIKPFPWLLQTNLVKKTGCWRKLKKIWIERNLSALELDFPRLTLRHTRAGKPFLRSKKAFFSDRLPPLLRLQLDRQLDCPLASSLTANSIEKTVDSVPPLSDQAKQAVNQETASYQKDREVRSLEKKINPGSALYQVLVASFPSTPTLEHKAYDQPNRSQGNQSGTKSQVFEAQASPALQTPLIFPLQPPFLGIDLEPITPRKYQTKISQRYFCRTPPPFYISPAGRFSTRFSSSVKAH